MRITIWSTNRYLEANSIRIEAILHLIEPRLLGKCNKGLEQLNNAIKRYTSCKKLNRITNWTIYN